MDTAIKTKILNVEKVYVTRNYDNSSAKPSKVVGLVVDGDIYWLKHSFGAIDELHRVFYHLNIGLFVLGGSGEWGVCDRYGKGVIDKPITKISKDPKAVFDKKSNYVKRSVLTEGGSLFWSVAELRDKFPDTPWYYADN